MPEHHFERSEDGTEAPIAKVWRKFHEKEECHRRWQKFTFVWRHQIGGVPTSVWILLVLAGIAALNLNFGRPWF